MEACKLLWKASFLDKGCGAKCQYAIFNLNNARIMLWDLSFTRQPPDLIIQP